MGIDQTLNCQVLPFQPDNDEFLLDTDFADGKVTFPECREADCSPAFEEKLCMRRETICRSDINSRNLRDLAILLDIWDGDCDIFILVRFFWLAKWYTSFWMCRSQADEPTHFTDHWTPCCFQNESEVCYQGNTSRPSSLYFQSNFVVTCHLSQRILINWRKAITAISVFLSQNVFLKNCYQRKTSTSALPVSSEKM